MNVSRSAEDTLVAAVVDLAALVWRHRRLVLLVMCLTSATTAAVTLLLKPRYTAEASVLPHVGASGIGNVLGELSGFSGFNLADPGVDLYPTVSRSRTVLDRVYAMAYHGAPVLDRLLDGRPNNPHQVDLVTKQLRKRLVATKDLRSNVVHISFTHSDPEFAAFLVNAILTQMDTFFRETSGAEASEQRKLIETRLVQVAAELARAEDELKTFRLANRVTMASPLLMLAEGRLVRQVEIKNRVYLELAAQLEVTKVREAGSVNALRVLDRAQVPQEKSWPFSW
jgi:tyrosine-protein kinase Etk/Wzc